MNEQAEQFELDAELKALDAQLRERMPVAPPADLAERVFAATVDRLPGGSEEAPAVIARIGPWQVARRVAAAAIVLLAVGLGTWVMWHGDPLTPSDGGWTTPYLDIAAAPSEPIDTDIEMLALDVEEFALAIHGDAGSTLDDSTVEEDLWLMESGYNMF